MSEKIVYLMRGLPSCGKSTTARRLAGTTGIVCETDEYFHTQVGDDPAKFNYRKGLMPEARRWNFERFKRAIDEGISPVVVDRGNSRSAESQMYVRYAMEHGYSVELREPESEWWQEIRVLLKYKRLTKPALYKWAEKLSKMNRSTHRVPAATIRNWMDKWKWDLTVDDILNYEPKPEEPADQPVEAAPARAPSAGAADAEAKRAQPRAAVEDLLPSEQDVLLQDSRLKPGERSPFL